LWFFSPDSRFIAFTKDGELKKIDVAGGPPTTIAKSDYTVQARGGSWNRDDVLIFGSPFGIVRVALADGKTSLLTEVAPEKELDHIVPFFLPDGRHFVYIRSGLRGDAATLFTGAMDNTPQQQPTQPLGATQGGGPANHLYYFPARNQQATAPGLLLFRRDNTVVAQPFDSQCAPAFRECDTGFRRLRRKFHGGAGRACIQNRHHRFAWYPEPAHLV
jgi:eukaryotic-like serine/threonine-protein kinase